MSEQCVILNDIHIDIMDYIKPAYCTEAQVFVYPYSYEAFDKFISFRAVPQHVDRIRMGESCQRFDVNVVSILQSFRYFILTGV